MLALKQTLPWWTQDRPRGQIRFWVPGLLVGAAAMAVYLLTLAPTLTWSHNGADGGDLIAAAQVLGVPHPPGYPLYTLLGHIWGRILAPVGDPAFRLNLFSAVCAAGAAVLLSGVIVRLTGPFEGLLGGLTFAFGPALWSQAVITEVYALNALCAVGFLAIILGSGRNRLGGLFWGLGWTAHLSSALLFPLLWWRMRFDETRGRGGQPGIWLAGFLSGLSLFLLLPLLASRQPIVNWGDPVTLDRWWWVVSGALYRGYLFGLPLADWPARAAALVHLAAQHFTWPGLGIMFWGTFRLARKDRSLCTALLAFLVLQTLFAFAYNTTDSHLFLIPVWMILTLVFSMGLSELSSSWTRWRPVRYLALAVPLVLLISGWTEMDLHDDREAADFGQRVMVEAPEDAVVYTASDAHTFALWYYRHAEGLRPDLSIVDQDMLAEEWYQTMLKAQDPRWSDGLSGRRVCQVSLDGDLNCDE